MERTQEPNERADFAKVSATTTAAAATATAATATTKHQPGPEQDCGWRQDQGQQVTRRS